MTDPVQTTQQPAVAMSRHITLFALLLLSACGPGAPGLPLERTDSNEEWFRAVDAVVEDWASEPSLPSIDTPRCRAAIASTRVYTVPTVDWPDTFGMCPYAEGGCYRERPCDRPEMTTCVTGTVQWHNDVPHIYLTTHEDASGHAITVRHETAHVLSWCTGRGLDYAPSHADVWGPQGVVHARPPRDPWRAAPRLLAR